jgi:diguanylate cyclase (GGDEF)-like protein
MKLSSILMIRLNITNKLAIIIIGGIISLAICLGVYFDNYLKEIYFKDAKKKIEHSFSRLIFEVQKIENNLKSGISFVQNDEGFTASIYLVNSYQNKEDYNEILLDEEKKLIALKLLDKVKLSLNDEIVLYDKNDEFIASVTKQNSRYFLNFLSYKNNQPVIYSKFEEELEYTMKDSKDFLLTLKHIRKNKVEDNINNLHAITYNFVNDNIYIKSHLNIEDYSNQNKLAHIEMSKKLDKAFFEALSKDVNAEIRINNKNLDLKSDMQTLSDNKLLENIVINQNDENYYSNLFLNTDNQIVGIEVSLDKHILQDALNEIRIQIFLIIVIIVLLMLFILRFLFNKLLGNSFKILMNQIQKIGKYDYSDSEVLKTGDELEVISKNVNNLALTLSAREKELQITNDNLLYSSNHDELTGLANRRYFLNELDFSIQEAKKNSKKVALLFIDLDYFKDINNTLGHNVGDLLLQIVATRLEELLDDLGMLVRLGGDEFVILVDNFFDEIMIENLAVNIRNLFKEKFEVLDSSLNVTASIGISIFPDNSSSGVELLKQSDLAMYHAKELGRDNYCFFSKELSNILERKMNIINSLKESLEDKSEFTLLYQPKISAYSKKMVSIESLIRWNSKKLGYVYPSSFISIAEETNMIISLGEWILKKACSDFQKLIDLGFDLNHISINISLIQLQDGNFFSILNRVIDETKIDPKKIELEITESFIATDSKKALEILSKIREKGISLAIDDFGTGYSSLSYLKKLPITRLKIDKSFVDDIPNSQESIAIAKAIISLAKSFGIAITAEGVENKEQLDFLINENCDEIQGYYFSKPITFEELKSFDLSC